MSVLWFTNPSTFKAAPDDTILAVQLILTESTIEDQMRLFKAAPLISNRSLTLGDLLAYTHGEIGWFITNDGRRSVALRATEAPPDALLDAFGLVAQQTHSNIVLLSETLMPVGGGVDGKLGPLFPNPFKKRLGQFTLPDQDSIHGTIQSRGGQIFLTAPYKLKKALPITIPQDTILALSAPVLPNSENVQISEFLSLLGGSTIQESMTHLKSLILGSKTYLLTYTDNKVEFLIETVLGGEVSGSDVLRTVAALNNPATVSQELLDGTRYQELIVDPDLITIAQISIHGTSVLKTSLSEQNDLLAAEVNNSLIITSSDDLLSYWLQEDRQTQVKAMCSATILYAKTQDLIQTISQDVINPSIGFITSIFNHFSVISVETKRGSIIVHLCT